MTKTKGGSIKPNGTAIRGLRIDRAFSVQAFADKVGCSKGTVENVERGENAYIHTIKAMADVLKVDFRTLLADPYTEPPPPEAARDRRVQVQITLSIPFEEFDQSVQLTTFLTLLQGAIGAAQAINVIGVTSGSVIITVEMGWQEWEALRDAWKQGKLADLSVSNVDVPVAVMPPDTGVPEKGTASTGKLADDAAKKLKPMEPPKPSN